METPCANPEKIEAVKRMQAFIAAHLKEPITQFQLSQAAGYSAYYAAKLFRELTGKTPFEYIRRLRLAEASQKLRDPKIRVIDVAFDYVFDSHEGFTRAFPREFGMTPKKYAMHPTPLPLFSPQPVRISAQTICEGEESAMNPSTVIFVQIMERPARKVLFKRAKSAEQYDQFCEKLGCEEAGAVWETLCAIPEALYEPIGMWMPENLRPAGTSVYTQGAELPEDWQGDIPAGFDIIQLPPCKMLVFQGPPYDDEHYYEAIGDLWRQTASFNPQIYGYAWADDAAPRLQLAPMGYRGYIEGRPVRSLNPGQCPAESL